MTKQKPKPYSDTTVAPEKSMSEAMQLLAQRRATGMSWTMEGAVTTLRFRWTTSDGTSLCARFRVEVKAPPAPRGIRWTSQQIDAKLEQEKRRLFRVLVYFIKNMFEAVDGGLMTLEQALLPYLEDGKGRTVAELMQKHLPNLSRGPLTLALGPGRDDEDV